MRITACQVGHMNNPVGYALDQTVFSWKVIEATGQRQISARLRVAEDRNFSRLLWDSGQANLNSVACEVQLMLAPRQRYYWDVEVTTDAGEHAVSEPNFFETGKRDEPWTAKWITCARNYRHPIFCKRFSVSAPVKMARLYICGLGLYEAYWGDKKIGQEHLTPYCNDYTSWLQVQTYDVTQFVEAEQELRVLLGNGWYKGRYGFSDKPYGEDFLLIAELHIDYEDGTHQVIATDESWSVQRSNFTFSSIYDGEHRDDTLPVLPAEPCALAHPPKGRLEDRRSTSVTAHEEMKPAALLHTPAGETVLDLGQNFAGGFRLRVHEPRGTVIHLQFGEVLQGGNFFRNNLRTAKAEYIYTSDGTEKVIESHFTFYGYRYVKVEGISNLTCEDFTGFALYSDLSETGKIVTGHPLVNQLISNIRWGLKSNFLDVPTDCPQRDERLGWTGDAQVFCPAACYLESVWPFFAKYLHDIEKEQAHFDGCVPQVIPAMGNGSTSSAWGDAVCIIPWTLYKFYGDKSILKAQFQSMRAWVDYIRRTDAEDRGWGKHFHFGDWLALDHETGDPRENSGATDLAYIAYIFYMNSADIVAKAAGVLGMDKEESSYRALAQEIRQYIECEFFTGSGRCSVQTQTGLLLALKYGLGDKEWNKARLAELFFHKNDTLLTGFVGTPLACSVLTENGLEQLAYKLLLREDYPGWLYAVKMGATTVWERWNSLLSDGSVSDTGMNSLNHYAYGSIAQWMMEYVGGIGQCGESVGFRCAKLQPYLNWKLKEADAAVDTPLGEYRLKWKITGKDTVKLTVAVPFGGSAKLVLPMAGEEVFHDRQNPMFAEVENGVCLLKPGQYSVSYQTSRPVKPEYSVSTSVRDLLQNPDIGPSLLQRLPVLHMAKLSMQRQPLEKLLLAIAGYGGLPDRETMKSSLIPQIDALIKNAEQQNERNEISC